MTASVPKRVFSLESPLTARAGPYMYLQPAGNSDRPPIRYNTSFTTVSGILKLHSGGQVEMVD
jgi:hypothetical protein